MSSVKSPGLISSACAGLKPFTAGDTVQAYILNEMVMIFHNFFLQNTAPVVYPHDVADVIGMVQHQMDDLAPVYLCRSLDKGY